MDKKQNKKMLLSGAVFVCFIALTFYLIFRKSDMGHIWQILSEVKLRFVAIGASCMVVFLFCEGMNVRRVLKSLGYSVGILTAFRYALIGFFFSSITPSSTGGQPVQLYYMHRDKIPVSHASLSLLMELSSYQIVVVSYALLGLICLYGTLGETVGDIKYLIAFGILGNLLYLLFILTAIFSKRLSETLIRGITGLMRRLHISRAEEMRKKLFSQLEEYQKGAELFRSKKGMGAKMVATTCLQMLAMYSIPYWVYCAFDMSGYFAWRAIALQAILYVAVSVLPLPGAVGVSEGGFLLLFQTLFPAALLDSAMLLSRGISFYLFVIVSGLAVLIFSLQRTDRSAECRY